ncbi:unnamed protein product, partial [Larinioides sclopetarius]
PENISLCLCSLCLSYVLFASCVLRQSVSRENILTECENTLRAGLLFHTQGIFAAIVLNLHINYRRRVLHLKYTPESLRMVKLCGLVLSIATLIASVVYFTLMAVYHQGYKLEGNGYGPAAIFSLLAMKWTIMMYFEGRRYERFLVASTSETSPVANGDPPPPYEATKP